MSGWNEELEMDRNPAANGLGSSGITFELIAAAKRIVTGEPRQQDAFMLAQMVLVQAGHNDPQEQTHAVKTPSP